MNWPKQLIVMMALIATTNCRASTGPYDALDVRAEVEPSGALNVGDQLTLRAIATNHGDRAVNLGYGCGEGLDFEVEIPTGERRFLLRGPSLCPVNDSNVLEPAETDTVAYRWTIPGPAGTYRVWAGGKVKEGLAARSRAIEFRVE